MPKILVVDDDSELRENICEILNQAGFETLPAQSGEIALELVDNSIDLILLDMIMPGIGGTASLPLFKQRHPSLRIVMVTAFATVENAVEAMRRGADDYVTKPFKTDELLMTIRKNIEEAKFLACRSSIDMEQTFSTLSNTMRRDLLHIIGREGRIRFMDLARSVEVDDHTKMNFHLKILKEAGLVRQDPRKLYSLSAEGKRVIECLQVMAHHLASK
jgi:DNA-binding response OmpR family regulator